MPEELCVRGALEISRSPELKREHDTERSKDSAHENKKYRVEKITLLFVSIVALLTAVQDYFSYSMSKTARSQLISSERPWVGPDEKLPVATGPITIDRDKHILTQYQLSAKSYGAYGANNLWHWAQLYVTQDISTIYDREHYACEQATQNPRLGRVIYPQQETIMSNRMPALALDIIPNTHADPPQKVFQAYLLACIGYRDSSGNPYHSGTIYRAVRPGTLDSVLFEITPNTQIEVEWHDWYSYID